MEVTANQALDMLGRIAFINERLDALLSDCYGNGQYDAVNEVKNIIWASRESQPLSAKVTITVDCGKMIKAVEQIADIAAEAGSHRIYQDANALLVDLVNLAADAKRQN